MYRRSLLLALALCVACGCGKKPAAPTAEPKTDENTTTAKPHEDGAAERRNKQLAALKNRQDAPRRAAIDELSFLVLEDPGTGPALVELLKDKTTNGPGNTRANQINSTREAAALALLKSGPKGEALLRDKGLSALREGLTDPTPAVREHTAYTIGQLGPVSKALAADVQKLCTDPDVRVRGAAFDALHTTGVANPVALSKLLTHESDETARLAGELVSALTTLPADAVEPLAAALKSDNPNVRRAAANALGAIGPNAAPAVPALIALLKKAYKDRDPQQRPDEGGPEIASWNALGRIGAVAVAPTAKLLDDSNALLRYDALRALGDMGPIAKPAAGAIKKVLQDLSADNALEAACALLRIGDSQNEALALLKRGLDSDSRGVAALAVQVIGRVGPAAETLVPAALTKLTSPDPFARSAALELVALRPATEQTKLAAEIGKLASDDERVIRIQVARTLVRLGPAGAPAADSLGRAISEEKDGGVRELLLTALLAMGANTKPALPALLPLTTDRDLSPPVRLSVLSALVTIDAASAEVSTALLKATQDNEAAVRAAAATALGRLDPLPPNALDALLKLVKSDSRTGPRVAALLALAAAGTRAQPARAEVEALTNSPQANLALLAKVAQAAIDGDTSKVAPAVRTGLRDRNPAVRAAAVEAVLVIGPIKDDLPALLTLLKELGSTTRGTAAAAIGRLGPTAQDAVPQLTRLLDDHDSEVRITAVEALGRIGPAAQPAVRKLKELLRDPLVWPVAQKALEKIEAK
ncbi:putative lyase [Gemmata obscuriglobus]|uniref:HEAT repeat domain-containing protein n=1 Tax=Gemmata obscuriglobus TaxID=114 RepID=A0A2Z3H5P3_9BACT|nr:HEAT repeat domain-containing protein [Gemmata obscuriglobus]AWM41343.1 hypothetical protein C1280_32995 [Gemmata obscuriglobus]QEG25304.1 putative lyase [Gemmata obscuriglobus]VTR98174.1 heat-repeat-containing pbs lyase : HEAT domain containing protein OS=Trichodesmium erythraeum (strain IMS101) GN=Tery_0826 PE=4 SV=1: HEAT_EZ: HEAT_2: HEAT_2: HEAT_2 [Gemmata obscuriglobus UQM 2246]